MEKPSEFLKGVEESREYRKQLADELRQTRAAGDREAARDIVSEEREDPDYQKAERYHREFEEKNKVIDAYLEVLLENAKFLGQGAEGEVFLIESSQLPDDFIEQLQGMGFEIGTKDAAAKLLKVFLSGQAAREAQMQQRAHQTLDQKASSGLYARVPAMHFTKRLRLGRGTDAAKDKEIIVMEAVPGTTIMETLYREYEARYPDADEVDRWRARDQDTDHLYVKLAKAGFRIDPSIVVRLFRTIHLLNLHRIYHHDLHAKNVMIDGSLEPGTTASPVIIDFGRADGHPKSTDDTHVPENLLVRRLSMLVDESVRGQMDRDIAEADFLNGASFKERGSFQYAGIRKQMALDRSGALQSIRAIPDASLRARIVLCGVEDGIVSIPEGLDVLDAGGVTSREAGIVRRWLEQQKEEA